jgi:lysophospholipase L1-like esterase
LRPSRRRYALLCSALFVVFALVATGLYFGRGRVYAALTDLGVMKRRQETEAYRRLVEGHARVNESLPADCVLLLGDSITEAFPAALTAPRHWANRGISGDRVRDVRARLALSALTAPCATVSLLVGSNDLVHERGRPAAVAREISEITREAAASGRRVVLSTVPPTSGEFSQWQAAVIETNHLLRENASRREAVRLLDLHGMLADAHGELLAEYSLDGLHLTEAAYRVWAVALAESVAARSATP